MNREDLYRSFNNIDDDILERSEANKKRLAYTWKKWGAIAACFCLIVGVLVPIVNNIFHPKGGYDSQDGVVPEVALLYFQGALYECCDARDGLNRLGLPSEITPEMAGEHVTYIEKDGPVEYQETAEETDIELLQYAPAPTKAVYILRSGENYMAVTFCRTYFPDDTKAYSDLAEVYRFFDISSASDIKSIAETDWHWSMVTGAKITDTSVIDQFYTLTTDITKFISMDNDAFQSIVFDGIPEEKQEEAHNAFADDCHIIRVETKDGFYFYLSYYPNYGFVYSGHAMAYHQVTPELRRWFETNMKIK